MIPINTSATIRPPTGPSRSPSPLCLASLRDERSRPREASPLERGTSPAQRVAAPKRPSAAHRTAGCVHSPHIAVARYLPRAMPLSRARPARPVRWIGSPSLSALLQVGECVGMCAGVAPESADPKARIWLCRATYGAEGRGRRSGPPDVFLRQPQPYFGSPRGRWSPGAHFFCPRLWGVRVDGVRRLSGGL
jgi:hypothetical protein